MKIIIDGDACPSISLIENEAKKYDIPVLIYCDIHHFIFSTYSEVKVVDDGFNSVDMYVVNSTSKGDIVVSQDYGVAAIALGKGAKVINPKGYIYTNQNIDRLLEERHIAQTIRRGGGRLKGPKKRSKEDEDRLLRNLRKLIEEKIN
ncbi:MAG: YaiI/YqxD family protein [Clostridium sp.]